ncbi:M36 family metallopeptidase [Verrucomicrobiota bacterium sgz303538]
MIKVLPIVVRAVALVGFFTFGFHAHADSGRGELANIDKRQERGDSASKPSRDAENAVTALRARLPSATVDWDTDMGVPRLIHAQGRFLTGARGEGGAVATAAADIPNNDPLRGVKAFLTEHRALFGHGPEALDAATKKRDHIDSHNGLRTVIWQQMVDGIPVFEALLKAHVTARGELVNIGTSWVRDAAAAADAGSRNRAALVAAPRISAAEALALAGSSVGDRVSKEQVEGSSDAEGTTRRQAFSATELSDASAELVWMPLGADALRLCWQAIFSSKARGAMFLALIDVETGEILLRRSLTEDISDATYRVFTSDSPTPLSPGHATPSSVQPPQVSRALITLQALNTTASPAGWIEDGVNETRGNNVDAHTDTDANNVPDTPRPQGSPYRVFDFPLDLTQGPLTYKDAAVTQLFYWCNFIHDKLYELGFTEAVGNFQNDNFGRGGVGNDAVQADAQDSSGTNNANFSTPPDGSPGRMQMFLWTGPTPDLDGAFDAEVVLHEYTHGLTNRLVGGGVGISALQSRGMGEGWSDFYSLAFLAESGDDVHGNWARGGYSRTLYNGTFTENYYFGGRRYPYSTNLTKNPLTFKDIDPTQASAHTGIPRNPIVGTTADEVHNVGEVWCVALWEIRANLISKHGFVVGNQLALQLVTDGLKLSPANPNFLQARDAILQAELVLSGGANRNELWAAFAKRGMGTSASSLSSSTASGVVEAFDLPDDLSVSPTASFTSSGQAGGPFVPTTRTYTLRNSGTTTLNWTASKNQPWLSLSTTSGSLAPNATVDVIATINSFAATMAAGTFTDTITFQNLASGANLLRPVSLTVMPPRAYYFSLDNDPGWVRTGQWAFGKPSGGGGVPYGRPDPVNGATGTNVLGVNLAGNYSTTIGGPYYVTTAALNLSGYTGTRLQFQRWLNTEMQPYTYATVEVSNNGTTWTQIWSNGSTIISDAAWTRVSYDISAIADKRQTVFIRWSYRITSGAYPYSGWNIDDIEILGTPPADLTVTLPASTTEGDQARTATITASPAPTTDLVVNLTASNAARLTVPANVTIPAGTTSATFAITAVDDALLNGTASVTVSPSATGWTSRSASILVNDNETAILSVNLPNSAAEGSGTVNGTVTASVAPASDVVVQLSSSMPGEAFPPATATITAGQTSAVFALGIADDTRIDGTQTVTITANVANWTSGSASIDVLDNENTDLSVAAPSSVREGDTAKTGSVSISGTLATDLIVTLNSSDTTELSLPATIMIPAGQRSAPFSLTVVDDSETDGAQTVAITANAVGFGSGQDSVSVEDNDVHHFAIAPIASPQVRGVAFLASVTAQDINNAVITNYSGIPNLTATGSSGIAAITPAKTGSFVDGAWVGNVTVSTFDTNVVLKVDDGAGHSGLSNSFDVSSSSSVDHFTWSTVPSPQVMDTPFAVTITATDAGNNPVSNFNGSADMAVLASAPVPPIGAGTSSSSVPLYGYYAKARTQVIYLANELGGAARLTSLALYINTASSQSFNNWTIRLKHATQSSFPSASWDNTGWIVVHQSTLTPSKTGWVTFNFSTPFDYNGTSNLLVDFSFNNTSDGGSLAYCRSSFGSSRTVYGYASSGDPLAWSGTTGTTPFLSSSVPDVQFTTERALPMRPGVVAFNGGVWSGNVSVPFAATSVRLSAADTVGHRGASNSFAVNVPSGTGAGSGGVTVLTENFESGTLGAAWMITGTSTYRTQITNLNGPRDTKHLTMDSSGSTYARNEATLTVNLAGRMGVVLKFWAKIFNDEPNGPPASPFTGGADFDGVAISADGVNWYEVQSLRSPTTSSSWTQLTVDLDAAIAARGISYSSAFKIRFNQYDDFEISTDGIAIDDIIITAMPIEVITVTLPAQAVEGTGALSGSVTLPAAQQADVTVSLASSSPAKVTVPASVIVPAGQVSVNFALAVLDDTVLDGAKTVAVTATALGMNAGSASMQVLDNDTGTLGLTVPASLAEGGGSVQGAVTLASPPAGNFTVVLASSDPTAVTIPASVSFVPGQMSAPFTITPVNDTKIDGTQSSTITASVPGWSDATAVIQVTDNENRNLTVYGLFSTYEGLTSTGTVSISGTLPTDLVVTLSSSATSQCTVPTSVTIPAGQTSASFVCTAVDDTLTDGTQIITVTASAATFISGSTSLIVYDNDVHHFGFSAIGTPKKTGVPFSVTITAQDVNNATITPFTGTVTLSAAGSSGNVPLTPAVSGSFSSGSWTGNVTCQMPSTNVRLTATSGSITGSSNTFEVELSPTISVSPSTLSLALPQGGTATRTLTIRNTAGSTLTWSIASNATTAEVVSEAPVVTREAVAKEATVARQASAPDPSRIHAEARENEEAMESLMTLTLAAARSNLDSNHGFVRATIPNRFNFLEGVTGSYISDGGNDMYDSGNYLNTNLGNSLAYSDTTIATSALLGAGGQYFTRKYDGLWVFAADINGLSYFEISGNLGADSGGSTDSSVLSAVRDGVTYRGFVKRVYGTSDPSVNHLIIVADNGSVIHEVSTDTNDDYHRLKNLTGITRVYYLLFAGSNGAYIDNTVTGNIMAAFLDAISAPDWISATPGSGNVAAGASQDVTIAVSTTDLTPGSYSRTLIINSNDPATPQMTVPVSLTVTTDGVLQISPSTGLASTGLRGGLFTPVTQSYTLTNGGIQPLNWTAAKTATWLDLSSTSGTLSPGASTTVTATINAGASNLASGSYSDTISFTNITNGNGNTTRAVALTISAFGGLSVTPATDLDATGPFGGPFTPSSRSYTLTNNGDAALNWTASKTASWLTLSSTAGSLAPGASTTVVATLNAAAINPGNYSDSITFTNTSNGRGNANCSVKLAVALPPPVLALEPQITPATSNTVTWSAVSGADAYEVQCSTDAVFTNPVSSGWIAGTSYTFTNLLGGTEYYYRVHARRSVNSKADTWSQTSQSDFSTGTASNVSLVSSPGNVVLGSNPAWTENFDQPGGSSSASIFPDVISSWNRVAISTSAYPNTTPPLPINQGGDLEAVGLGGAFMTDVPANRFTNGVIEAYLYPTQVNTRVSLTLRGQRSPTLQGYQAGISRVSATEAVVQIATYGFTGSFASSPTFPFSPPNECFRMRFAASGSTLTVSLWRVAVSGGVVTETPVILENGVNSIVRTGATQASGVAGIYALAAAGGGSDMPAIDDVTVTVDGSSNSFPSGTLTSAAIVPPQWQRWGVLTYTKDTSATGTALTVDVLSSTGALLAADVVSSTDLNSITAVANQPSISLRANLSTANGANTPRLADWSVQYFTELEQTFVSVWSAVETSTQFNEPPTITAIGNQAILEDGATGLLAFSIGDDATPATGLALTVASSDPVLVPQTGIQLAGTGVNRTVQVTPAANQHGSAVVTLRVLDGGGKSTDLSFTVTVSAVNDAPAFIAGANQTVAEDCGPQSLPGWATSVNAGPANESAQILEFDVTNDSPSLFATPPSITSNGTLNFTPSPNAYGSATITVRLRDNGGIANGGSDTSAPQTFRISVTPVDDAPTVNALGDIDLAEDAPEQRVSLSGISSGADNELQSLVVSATSNNPALIANPEVTYTSPASTGMLRFTVAGDSAGEAVITVAVSDGGQNPATTRSFRVRVAAVNDAPSFVKGADSTVLEDGGPQTIPDWATAISAGPADENTQSIDFIVTNDKPALFSAPPAISPDGSLSFTPAPNANGSTTVTVRLHDSGGISNGGSDTSAAQVFTITVTAVNDPPVFVKGGNQAVRQNAGPMSIHGWATELSPGPVDEAGQALNFIVSNDNPGIFSVAPAVAPDGTLTFTPATGVNGTATVTLRLHDNGGTENGGSDTSAPQTFIISSTFVNDAPSFVRGPDMETAQDAGPQTIPGWAKQIIAGPEDEAGQTLDFRVSVEDANLFTVPPAIASDGTLTYVPAPGASGTTTVTVQLHDNGGTDDGGTDLSAPQTFTISITTYAEEFGTYNGLVTAAPGEPLDADHTGLLRVSLHRNGAFTGNLVLGGKVQPFKGRLDRAGVAQFGAAGATTFAFSRHGQSPLLVGFKVDVANGTDKLAGTIQNGSGVFAIFSADRALFTARRNPVSPLRNLPSELVGRYTIVFAARPPAEQEAAATEFPQGDGAGTAIVSPNGVVRLIGQLADGTPVSYANYLSKAYVWPFYQARLGGYAISGPVQFRDVPEISDCDGYGLYWFRASRRAGLYPPGWPHGIRVDLIGSRYQYDRGTPVIADLPRSLPEGNAMLTLTDGGLNAEELAQPLSIGNSNRVVMPSRAVPGLALRIDAPTGLFRGRFTHPVTHRISPVYGAFLQKQRLGSGAFRTNTAVGGVSIEPQ